LHNDTTSKASEKSEIPHQNFNLWSLRRSHSGVTAWELSVGFVDRFLFGICIIAKSFHESIAALVVNRQSKTREKPLISLNGVIICQSDERQQVFNHIRGNIVFVEHGHVPMLDLKGKQRTAKTRRRKKSQSQPSTSFSFSYRDSFAIEREGGRRKKLRKARGESQQWHDMEIVWFWA
jgi:hypothetical protein